MWWTGKTLSELSGGSARRAAAVIVAAHLLPLPVLAAIWAVGLLPVFDDLRWIPGWTAVVVGSVLVLGLFRWFGIWGTLATGLQDHGEEYTETFTPLAGFGLGWLRWFMQLVAVTLALVPTLMIWTDVRAWHVFGTDELRALPDRAAAVPVPDEWELVDTTSSGFGLTRVRDWPDADEPEGYVERTFEVPSTYTFEDLERWLAGPGWSDDPGGDPFGAVEVERCDADSASCRVRLVPEAGQQPEHFVTATLREPSYDGDEAEVAVRVVYEKYVTPDWGVSQETVERAMAIPVPPGWVRRSDVNARTNDNGESVSQSFRAPASTTPADVEAWLTGPHWSAPATGEPFGELGAPDCREVGTSASDRRHLCSAIVVRDRGADGPVESMRWSLDVAGDRQVRVTLERNG